MPHLSHYCSCGRKIHWSKYACVGETWTCRRCGRVSQLVDQGGQPGRILRSKPHKDEASTQYSIPNGISNPHRRQSASPAGCFPGDAKVLTPMGYQRIDSLMVGDMVESWQMVASKLVSCRITRIVTRPRKRIWTVEFQSQEAPIRSTAYHTVLTQRGWARINQLQANDRLVSCNLGKADVLEVSRIFKSTKTEPVYNLVTTGEHNFVVEGLVAHNFTFLRRTRTLLHRWFLDHGAENTVDHSYPIALAERDIAD